MTPAARHRKVTDRELEVYRLSRQLGRKCAAHELGISDSTARNHITHLFAKLGAANTWQADIALGWLRPPESMGQKDK